jgi:predicted O-methyltransferase YrrM
MIKMDRYSTHLGILKQLFGTMDIKTVFEFGTGFYSTGLFCENCNFVVACEMQSEEWYNKVKDRFEEKENLSLQCMIGPNKSIEYLSSLNRNFDLIFVDGHGDSRWHAINEASRFTKLIVSHDTETSSYQWHKINLDSSWTRKDYKDLDPWTTVWVKK